MLGLEIVKASLQIYQFIGCVIPHPPVTRTWNNELHPSRAQARNPVPVVVKCMGTHTSNLLPGVFDKVSSLLLPTSISLSPKD